MRPYRDRNERSRAIDHQRGSAEEWELGRISSVRRRVGARRHRPARPYEPIVAELFSVERLEQHGESLAAAQRSPTDPRRGHGHPAPRHPERPRPARLLPRARAGHQGRALDHPGRRVARRQLPHRRRAAARDPRRPAVRLLPRAAQARRGPSRRATPRVVGIAWAYVAHTDSRFDPESLRRFVRAYQRVEPLTIGELWAIAISLRIVLVENLRRLAEQIVRSREARQSGQRARRRSARPPEGPARGQPRPRSRRLAGRRCRQPARCSCSSGCATRTRPSRRHSAGSRSIVAAQGTSGRRDRPPGASAPGGHERDRPQRITSMRLISWFDWAEFVESVSLVDEVLDEGSSFGAWTSPTRDRYRHAIEGLARALGSDRGGGRAGCGGWPRSSARSAPPACDAQASSIARPVHAMDPGYYLISRRTAGARAGARLPCPARLERLRRASVAHGHAAAISARLASR